MQSLIEEVKKGKKKEVVKTLESCDKLPWYESISDDLLSWTGYDPFPCKKALNPVKNKKTAHKKPNNLLQLERIKLALQTSLEL